MQPMMHGRLAGATGSTLRRIEAIEGGHPHTAPWGGRPRRHNHTQPFDFIGIFCGRRFFGNYKVLRPEAKTATMSGLKN